MDGDCACGTGMTDLPVLFPGRRFKKLRIQMIDDSGGTVPNSSYLLGDICSGALSNLYYPKANRGPNLVLTNAAIGLAGRVGTNLVREFLSKLLTRSVPRNGNL
jgi:hypothetical protein